MTNLSENPDNQKIDIAIGKHRNTKRWQNRQLTWQELVEKCRQTHRTAETIDEYLAAPKSRQDEIKDIGGFVGAYLINGSRKRTAVMHRQILTLDADFAKPDLWDSYKTVFGNAAALYTTHKHTAEKPRFRLVILANRPMEPEEYEPICRYVTGSLGIDQFDPTTYDPERLMYWPSTSKDGEFLFESADGSPLDVDGILSRYRNWKDSSEWPMSDLEKEKVRTGITKQGDPESKPGVVGLFCRTYNLQDVLEKFLPDIYEPTLDPHRYTYTGGSTTGGLVIYDEKFAYSHHGTDPAGGKLSNAFDLVRIHKFGSLDENAKEDTPINRMPSTVAMNDFAMNDEEVKRQRMKERVQEVKDDFDGVDVEFDEEDLDWMEKLDMNRRGEILPTHSNVERILENDRNLKERFRYNELQHRIDVTHPMPWTQLNEPKIKGGRNSWLAPMEDDDERGLRTYFGKQPYNLSSAPKIADVYPLVAKKNKYHPVKEYLESLVWDGKKRVETALTDYLGAEDSELNRTFIRKWMCAAVQRVYCPGTKFDNVLTLIGPEGTRKSTFFRSLGLSWFSDTFSFSMLSGNGVRAYEQLQGKWIIEIAEIAGLKKAEVEASKAFLSASEDSFRASYGRHTSVFPRQCVFGATTNSMRPLVGHTGNRRFWPVKVAENTPIKKIDGSVIERAVVDQLWAEVMEIWEREPLFLSGDMEEQARKLQDVHTETDGWTEKIMEYLDIPVPSDWLSVKEDKTTSKVVRVWSEQDRVAYIRTALGRSNYYTERSDVPEKLMPRNRVISVDIWDELFSNNFAPPSKSDIDRIKAVMGRLPDWKESTGKKKYCGKSVFVFERVKTD